jgi:multisubunit Na+/H+ antiporter MnhB subunit
MIESMWGESSILQKLGIILAVGTAAYAVVYAWRPTESRLALLRPLSLATVFAALCSFSLGVAIVLNGLSATPDSTAWRTVALGASETFGGLFVSFGCLTIAWLCVAFGLRRVP